METFLALDNRSKQLCLHAKKRFEHSGGVALKVNTVLNTVTAAHQVDGQIYKFFRLGGLPRYTEDDIWRVDTRLRLGVGARASTLDEDVHLSLTAKQHVPLTKSSEVVRGRHVMRSYTQAKVKAEYNYNLRSERWGGEAVAQLSRAVFRFADDQDVRVTAGCRVPLTASGPGRAEPFLRVQENCWSVTANQHGDWRVMYSL